MTFFRLAFLCLAFLAVGSAGPAGRIADPASGVADAAQPAAAATRRPGFLGAFLRAAGTPPYGPFSALSKRIAPRPYPSPGTTLFGPAGYCDQVAANGVSISTGYKVDPDRLSRLVDLGVGWTRTGPAQFFDDGSHVFGPTVYRFADLDAVECALVRNKIVPLMAIEAGPVQYNAVPNQFSPHDEPTYKTPADFGTWCGVVTRHEKEIFPSVLRYSSPGNEVNSAPKLFPGGEAQIAAYAEACYHAIKSVEPKAFVYGFELNMDKRRDPVGFVQRMYDLGCKVGTCYDGISMHLSLKYPIPSADTPCDQNRGGAASLQCIEDVRNAAHAPIHVIIGETVYLVPASVPDETTKAAAIVDALKAFASIPYVDGVNYANVDECDLYPSGYFIGGCVVDSRGQKLPGYAALKALSAGSF